MPSLTIKNIPAEIYRKLKAAAQANHRSINGEVIACLESGLSPVRVPVEVQLARVRKVRESVGQKFDPHEILEAIEHGRRT